MNYSVMFYEMISIVICDTDSELNEDHLYTSYNLHGAKLIYIYIFIYKYLQNYSKGGSIKCRNWKYCAPNDFFFHSFRVYLYADLYFKMNKRYLDNVSFKNVQLHHILQSLISLITLKIGYEISYTTFPNVAFFPHNFPSPRPLAALYRPRTLFRP